MEIDPVKLRKNLDQFYNNKEVIMRDRFIILMTIIMSIIMLISINTNAESFSVEKEKFLYIESEPVSKSCVKYLKEEQLNIFSSLRDVVEEELYKLNDRDRIYFGNGFVLNEIEYIPILCNNKIIALLAILEENDEYSWTLSADFSEGLNKIASKTSAEKPAKLYTNNGNVYADISGVVYQLTFNPKLESFNQERLMTNFLGKSKDVINIYNKMDRMEKNYFDIVYELRALSSNNLALDLKETQGDQSWCSAFAGAQILRYRSKGNIYAEDIMKYYYPDDDSTSLKKRSITNSELIEYANMKGSYPSKTNDTLSINQVKSQIDSDKPIYLGCEGKDTYKKSRHALVLRGYNIDRNTYSVWNPWNAKYISMSISSKSIAVSGGKFVWDSTIYDW